LGLDIGKFVDYPTAKQEIAEFTSMLSAKDLTDYPLIVLTEDPLFAGQTLNNFLWVTFTRANPSHDIYGVDSSIEFKHWGCKGPLVIDYK